MNGGWASDRKTTPLGKRRLSKLEAAPGGTTHFDRLMQDATWDANSGITAATVGFTQYR